MVSRGVTTCGERKEHTKAKITVPKGWRLVNRGRSVEHDRYFLPLKDGGGMWTTVNGITDNIGIPVSNFIYLIRRKRA